MGPCYIKCRIAGQNACSPAPAEGGRRAFAAMVRPGIFGQASAQKLSLIHILAAYNQNRPLMTPFSSTSIASAAGLFGRPGIVIMLPISATTKPAPADRRTLFTVMVKPSGAPRSEASSEKPVSYTHLDVYKRQPQLCWGLSFR